MDFIIILTYLTHQDDYMLSFRHLKSE